ncbi:ABC transporter permease [Candidatus Omnitrophota bacterium]
MLKAIFKRFYRYRHILWTMSVTNLKLKYAGSVLGIWWAVVGPLILAGSISFIFTVVFKVGKANFTLFALSGIIPWMFFTCALLESTNSFIVNSSILRQSIFPREFIPIATTIGNFLNFLMGFIFLLPIFIIFKFEIITLLPVLILVILIHFLFVLGLGLLFSCINVFFRDLYYFLAVGMMVWFWVTPIFYSLEDAPFPYRWICLLNPMTHYVALYQKILFKSTCPSLVELCIAFIISILFLLVGYLFISKNKSGLLKRI